MKHSFDDFNIEELTQPSEAFPIISFEEEKNGDVSLESGDILPILPLRNMVLYPGVLLPVSVARPKSLKLVREAKESNHYIGVCTQKDKNIDDPTPDQLYSMGTVAKVVRILEMNDNTTTVILEGKSRFFLGEVLTLKPYMKARINLAPEIIPSAEDGVFPALVATIKDMAAKIIANAGIMPPEAVFAIRNIDNPVFLINYVCVNFGLNVQEKQRLLEIDDILDRGYQLLDLLNKEWQLLEIKISIENKAKEGIDQQQKQYFLQQQMKTIQEELGGASPEQDILDFREKAKQKKWNENVAALFEKELKKLERMSPHSPDYTTQLNYVETLLELPWNEYTKDNFNLKNARKVLEQDHFGMETVKERILEHLAVLKLKGDMKSPIICLYGPPGTGKTSLGKSIARALNRKYVRISLGGLHDEAEIRGHRRTYIGALPGRIMQNIQKAQSANPVFVLDEIDKVAADYKGDPSSALLEVLDPEQNTSFHDNYLDVDFDLSKVMFIATANNLNTIPRPLLDRMELIEVSGYTQEEKVEIARRHLVPKELENHGLTKEQLILTKPVIEHLIENYTRESGVRELDRQIASLMRKIAKKVASNEPYNVQLTVDDLKTFLGVPRYTKEKYQGNDYAGVVTGLAWTQVGGEILYIESSLSKSKSPQLTLTGNLGEVMKESAVIALEYIKAHAEQLGIDSEMFEKWNVHIHVPEGAIPKDGPSAGITMLTALVSAFTKRKVRKNLAMTGEITLRGKVLPVGGIKEKILAAKRAGITELVLCEENKKDVEEINASYLKGLHFHYVNDIMEVINFALLDEKVRME
ncbi:MAG: endopeptidase La [Paludibacteraceae bacterium]|nr:endopeptidase La [Paludibacteraceae bacterium]MBP8967522.1 endopeptidase La [Paludibacteraceae bacterium]OPZ01345.1 MAG: Lon protease 1 [Bacteroidetes bacterium ADurb.BinA395]HOR39867.1 endopeptidase La [Paludibacteraceae bacterium]